MDFFIHSVNGFLHNCILSPVGSTNTIASQLCIGHTNAIYCAINKANESKGEMLQFISYLSATGSTVDPLKLSLRARWNTRNRSTKSSSFSCDIVQRYLLSRWVSIAGYPKLHHVAVPPNIWLHKFWLDQPVLHFINMKRKISFG
jgi:hypothetical protein